MSGISMKIYTGVIRREWDRDFLSIILAYLGAEKGKSFFSAKFFQKIKI